MKDEPYPLYANRSIKTKLEIHTHNITVNHHNILWKLLLMQEFWVLCWFTKTSGEKKAVESSPLWGKL